MQYTKPMIDLVYEIRRRVDANMKPSVKMANPDVMRELAEYHHHTTDNITKTLIKELLFLAGPTWSALLEPMKLHSGEVPAHPKQVVKVYRGQTMLVDALQAGDASPQPANKTLTDNQVTLTDIAPPKPVRIYRGNPVAS